VAPGSGRRGCLPENAGPRAGPEGVTYFFEKGPCDEYGTGDTPRSGPETGAPHLTPPSENDCQNGGVPGTRGPQEGVPVQKAGIPQRP
jgi:hypothetical protein